MNGHVEKVVIFVLFVELCAKLANLLFLLGVFVLYKLLFYIVVAFPVCVLSTHRLVDIGVL